MFVYGTLLAGESNHRLLQHARLVGEARTAPSFTLYDLGRFPAMVAGGADAVVGEVYEVDEQTRAALDRLEGHPSLYCRTLIALESGREVEAYLLPPEQLHGAQVITSASWRARSNTADED